MNAGLQKAIATVLSIASVGTGFTLANNVENPEVLSPVSQRFVVSEKFDDEGNWIAPALREVGSADDQQDDAREALASEFNAKSEKAELTSDEALQIALDHAELTKEDLVNLEVELDRDRTGLHYEIEFNSNNHEFEYDVDAVTGEILKNKKEHEDDYVHVDLGAILSMNDAYEIALERSAVNPDDVTELEKELDNDDGRLSFEIEFKVGRVEYEFDIDAKTGEIIKYEKDDSKASNKPSDKSEFIGREAALEAALAHAGVSRDDISDLEIDLDEEDDRFYHYDIEFDSGEFDYEYDIDAVTGEVVSHEKDRDDRDDRDRPRQTTQSTTQSTTQATTVAPTQTTTQATTARPTTQATTKRQVLGNEAALNRALAHAGVARADIYDLEIELDKDDGRLSYEIEFDTRSYEYEFDLDAYTGEILEYERDHNDDDDDRRRPAPTQSTQAPTQATQAPTQATTRGRLSKDEAINIALNHAGLSRNQVRFDDVELDEDDGYLIWEIEFEVGNYEYEYDINARNGSIIEWEREYDD